MSGGDLSHRPAVCSTRMPPPAARRDTVRPRHLVKLRNVRRGAQENRAETRLLKNSDLRSGQVLIGSFAHVLPHLMK